MQRMGPDIRFIRLDDDICEELNQRAAQQHERVSDLANELIRKQLAEEKQEARPHTA